MSKWKSININENQVQCYGSKCNLIKMPNNSDFKGWCFWHPAKLLKNGKHSAACELVYSDDFNFKLVKMNNYNQIKDSKLIGVDEFEEAFEITNENIQAKGENKYETHKPEALEAKQVEVLDELKDD